MNSIKIYSVVGQPKPSEREIMKKEFAKRLREGYPNMDAGGRYEVLKEAENEILLLVFYRPEPGDLPIYEIARIFTIGASAHLVVAASVSASPMTMDSVLDLIRAAIKVSQ